MTEIALAFDVCIFSDATHLFWDQCNEQYEKLFPISASEGFVSISDVSRGTGTVFAAMEFFHFFDVFSEPTNSAILASMCRSG